MFWRAWATLTYRAVALLGRAGPAEHGEAALHPRSRLRLGCHCQLTATDSWRAGVLTGDSSSPEARVGASRMCVCLCAWAGLLDGGPPSSRLGARAMRRWASRLSRDEEGAGRRARHCLPADCDDGGDEHTGRAARAGTGRGNTDRRRRASAIAAAAVACRRFRPAKVATCRCPEHRPPRRLCEGDE